MAWWNFGKKKEESRGFEISSSVDGVELVSGNYRIHSKLERRNIMSAIFHLDFDAKIELYEHLTGIKITEEDIKISPSKSFHDREKELDVKITEILRKKQITIVLK